MATSFASLWLIFSHEWVVPASETGESSAATVVFGVLATSVLILSMLLMLLSPWLIETSLYERSLSSSSRYDVTAGLLTHQHEALFELRPPTYGNSPAFSSAMLNKAFVGLSVELIEYFADENTEELELLKTRMPQHSRRGNRIFLNSLCSPYIHQLMAVCRPEDMRSGIPIAVPTIILHQARATTT